MKEETWPIKDVDKDEYLDWNQDDVDDVESERYFLVKHLFFRAEDIVR